MSFVVRNQLCGFYGIEFYRGRFAFKDSQVMNTNVSPPFTIETITAAVIKRTPVF